MKKRPIYLNVVKIRLPITGLASILHRMSGLLLFFFIPLILLAFERSLRSEADFEALKGYFTTPVSTGLLWLTVSALVYHCLAGLRHLLMDMHVGDSKAAGRFGAMMVLILGIGFAAGFAWKLWGGV